MQSQVTLSAVPNRQDMFAWLIDPIPASDFMLRYYEQRLCHIVRSDPKYYADLIIVDDLDAVLGTHDVPHPDISLVRGENPIQRVLFTHRSGKIDARKVVRCFDEGATIVFNQLHRRVFSLNNLCASIGTAFGSRIQTNVYLTPPNAQGFKPHWDTHDVFVLQILGRKHWTTYDSTVKLPLKGQGFNPEQDVPGPISEQFDLRAGDAAYVPRGLMHSARSSSDASLHVTLGVMAFTWADLLLEAVAATALQQESLRTSLPVGWLDETFSAARGQLVREKLDQLVACMQWADVWRHFQKEFHAANAPLFSDGLALRLAAGRVTLASRAMRRTGVIVMFEERGTDCALYFCGQRLSFPLWMQPAVSFVSCRTSFTVSAVPDCVDDEGKIAFVNRLMREGLLQVEDK